MGKFKQNPYPDNWEQIASDLKERHGWKCERCGHPHEVDTGYVLTIHHLDGDPANNQDWNLACLCQRCHLKVQGRINIFQTYMFILTDWFEPHYRGFLEAHHLNQREGESVSVD